MHKPAWRLPAALFAVSLLGGVASQAYAQTAGVSVAPTALTVLEDDTSTIYTVVLDAAPSGDVTVTPSSDDGGLADTSGALTFSTGDWNMLQTVTVTVTADADTDIDTATISHMVDGYGSVNTAEAVTVVVTEDRYTFHIILRDRDFNAVDTFREGERLIIDIGVRPTLPRRGSLDFIWSMSARDGFDGVEAEDFERRGETLSALPMNANALIRERFGIGARSSIPPADYDIRDDGMLEGVERFTVTVSLSQAQLEFVETLGGAALPQPVHGSIRERPAVVIEPAAVTVAEDGGTATYRVHLDSPVDSDVTVTPSSASTARAQVSAALTFTSANWNAAQTVTVTGAADSDSADDTVTVSHAVAGSIYEGVTAPEVAVTVRDGDPGVRVSRTSVSVGEGATLSYTVVLQALPDADVTVTASSDNADVTVSGALTFAAGNWNTPQAVTLTVAEDADAVDERATVSHAVSSASGNYAGVASAPAVAVTVPDTRSMPTFGDASVGGFNLLPFQYVELAFPRSLGGNGTLTYELTTVQVSSGSAIPPGLTLDLDTLTLSGTPTGVGSRSTLRWTVTDSERQTASSEPFLMIAQAASVVVSAEPNFTVAEGAMHIYSVHLSHQPPGGGGGQALVTPSFGAGLVEPAALTFTASDWSVARSVTLTAPEDDNGVDDTVTLSHAVSGYGEVTVADRFARVTDNDTPGVVFEPAAVTVGEGQAAVYSVVLTTEPAFGDVRITPSSSEPAVATVTSGALTFTAANWDFAQTVSVLGAEDADDTDSAAVIRHTAFGTTGEPTDVVLSEYIGVPGEVAVTVTDNDVPGLFISPTTLRLREGANAVYSVRLHVQPSGDVTVTPVANAVSLTFSAGALTFTDSTWNTAQAVTVTATADSDTTDAAGSITHTVDGADYGSVMAPVIAVAVIDSEAPAVLVTPESVVVLEGGMRSLSVVLQVAPDAQVELTPGLTPGDHGLTLAPPGALTFTTGNWNTAQSVIMSAATDADAADGRAALSYSAGASAGNYAGVSVRVPVSVLDTRAPRVSVSAATVDVVEGETATYAVRLNAAPLSDVTVTTSVTPGGHDLTLAPAMLTFAPGNWSAPQSITVTAGEDDSEYLNDTATISHATSGANYDNAMAVQVAVTVSDDDPNPLSLSAGNVNVGEGGSATYAVRLSTAPPSDVTVTPSVTPDGHDLTLAPAALTFTPGNWSDAQSITVTAGQDEGEFLNDTATISHTISGANYDNVVAVRAVVRVIDDDINPNPGALAFTPPTVADQTYTQGTPITTLTLPAATGGSGSPVYSLTGLPGNLGLTYSASDLTLSGTPATSASFTLTWSATDGMDASDSVSLTFDVLVQVPVTVGFERTAYRQSENVGQFQVCVLVTNPVNSSPLPSGGISLSVSTSIESTDTISAGEFTAINNQIVGPFSNSRRQECFLVEVADDSAVESMETFSLLLVIPPNEGAVDDVFAVTVTPNTAVVTITDDDMRGVTLGATALTVTEGGSGTYSVRLDSSPVGGSVTVTPSSRDTTVATVSAALTFTGSNWNTAQTVSVTGATDANAADDTATVSHAVSGADYGSASIDDVTVTVTDSDMRGVTLGAGALSVNEGGNNSYTVVLDSQPVGGSVTVTPGSGDPTVATVGGALTFGTGNWNTPQTVQVTGVRDFDAVTETATLSHAVGGADYAGVTTGDVVVTVTDPDTTGVTVSAASRSVAEGVTVPYTVVLDSQPVGGDVTITPSSGDSDAATVSGALIFNSGNWNVAQTVQVTGVRDFDAVTETATVSHAVQSASDYAGVMAGNVVVTVTDLDTAGVTFSAASRSVVEGATVTYTVVLDSQPVGGEVTVTPSSGDPAVATVAGALIFGAGNWNVAQTVRVTGVRDFDAVAETATVSHAVQSASDYAGVSAGGVVVTVTDLDTAGVTISPTSLTLVEGTSGTYTVVLDSEPFGGNVTITPNSSDPTVAAPSGALIFALGNWNTAQTVAVTGVQDADALTDDAVSIRHAVSGADYGSGVAAPDVQIAVTEDDVDEVLRDLNEVILPEVARAVVVQQMSAVAERVGRAGGALGGGLPGFNLNGQSSLAGVAAAHAKDLAGGDLDMKHLLRDMDFVMPLGAGGPSSSGGGGSLALWGGSEYHDFSGEDGGTEWDGDTFSLHLGFDARVRSDLLAGLMLSYSDSDSDYSYTDGGRIQKGEYALDMTSVNPYLNWDLPGGAKVWVTAGYGEGELEVTPDDPNIRADSSDVNMRTFGAGGSRQVLDGGDGQELRVKADVFFTRAEIEGGDAAGSNIVGLEVDASRVRLALESRHPRTLSGGARLTPAFELGLRHDGGDGQTGSGVEVGGSLNYRDFERGMTLEGRARALLAHDGGHRGWGIGGFVRIDAGLDEQGLSLSLSPGYGDVADGIDSLWDNGVRERDAAADNPQARLQARLGYGLPMARLSRFPVDSGGILTPYSALNLGDDKRKYRLGAQWQSGGRFDLDLFAERTDGKASDDAVVLKGELRF